MSTTASTAGSRATFTKFRTSCALCATYALTQALLAANLHPKQDPLRANALNLGGIPVNAPVLPNFKIAAPNRRILVDWSVLKFATHTVSGCALLRDHTCVKVAKPFRYLL